MTGVLFIAVALFIGRARPQPGARRQVPPRARGGRPHARQKRQRDRARDAGASRGPRGADGRGQPVQRAVQLSGGGDGRQLEVRAFRGKREITIFGARGFPIGQLAYATQDDTHTSDEDLGDVGPNELESSSRWLAVRARDQLLGDTILLFVAKVVDGVGCLGLVVKGGRGGGGGGGNERTSHISRVDLGSGF